MTPKRKARLLLECLEGRAMPATFTVTTTLDVVDPADGKLSLREAVTRANNRAGADVIALPAGVFRVALAGAARSRSGRRERSARGKRSRHSPLTGTDGLHSGRDAGRNRPYTYLCSIVNEKSR